MKCRTYYKSNNTELYHFYLSYAFETGYFVLTVPKDNTNRASIVLMIIYEVYGSFFVTIISVYATSFILIFISALIHKILYYRLLVAFL